jgi:hypothetical protein
MCQLTSNRVRHILPFWVQYSLPGKLKELTCLSYVCLLHYNSNKPSHLVVDSGFMILELVSFE